MNVNKSIQSYNKNKTPARKRVATPCKGKATVTPSRHRVAVPTIPRMSRTRPTKFATPLATPDRFIPSRSRMNSARVQASLRAKHSRPAMMGPSGTEYESHLRRALWGSSAADDETPLMSFGSSPTPPTQASSVTPIHHLRENHDPYRQDVLRSLSQALVSGKRRRDANRQISIELKKGLEAPKMLLNDDLTLIGCGQAGAFVAALGAQLFFSQDGTAEVLAETTEGTPFTCVQWSDDSRWFAVGMSGAVHIWHPEESDDPAVQLYGHTGYVTAIAWKGMELLVACQKGISRYALHRGDEEGECIEAILQAVYASRDRVTALEWKDDTIASSSASGQIKLWSANQCGGRSNNRDIQPRCVMNHSGATSLQLFTHRQSNLLVSGGDGGIKFWNVWNGSLRASVEMEGTVTGTICLPETDEIVVGTGKSITVWTMTPSMDKVVSQQTGGGNILCMVQSPEDGAIVCAHDDETISMHTIRREAPPKRKVARVADIGLLKFATLR